MSVLEAARHYGIGGSMTLYRWLSDHKDESEMSKKPLSAKKSASELAAELAAEVSSLKKLLEQERVRSEAYLTMIKLAEEQFQIPIEKSLAPNSRSRKISASRILSRFPVQAVWQKPSGLLQEYTTC